MGKVQTSCVTKGDAFLLYKQYTRSDLAGVYRISERRVTVDELIRLGLSDTGQDETDSEPLAAKEIPDTLPSKKVNGVARKSYRNLPQYVNKCLNLVCTELKVLADTGHARMDRFRREYIEFHFEDDYKFAVFSWKPYSTLESSTIDLSQSQTPEINIIKTVFIIGELMHTDFSNGFMRGARSMARALGADLIDRRIKESKLSAKVSKEIKEAREAGQCGAVFYFVDEEINQITIKKISEHVPFIRAGHDAEGSISINYAESAELILSCIQEKFKKVNSEKLNTQAETQKKAIVVLPLIKDTLQKYHHVPVRQAAYISLIDDDDEFHQFPLLDLKPIELNGYESETNSLSDAGYGPIREAVETDKDHEIFAILGRSHSISLKIIDIIKNNNRSPDKCNSPIFVFGENFTNELMNCLNEYSNPLEALCSADPYYIGRYTIRAIIKDMKIFFENDKQSIKTHPKVPPVLISKERVGEDKTPLTLDRLSDAIIYDAAGGLLVDVCLDGDEFAWKDWMRDDVGPHSFGPDHRKRHLERHPPDNDPREEV